MRRINVKTLTLTIVLGLMLSLPPICCVASASPMTTVMVNGAKLLGPDYFLDFIMLEAKARMNVNTFVSGAGSVHGILCGATYLFQLTEVTIGQDSIAMRGTIVATNKATREGVHNYYSWIFEYPDVEITANLDGSHMHFIVASFDFVGSRRVII